MRLRSGVWDGFVRILLSIVSDRYHGRFDSWDSSHRNLSFSLGIRNRLGGCRAIQNLLRLFSRKFGLGSLVCSCFGRRGGLGFFCSGPY